MAQRPPLPFSRMIPACGTFRNQFLHRRHHGQQRHLWLSGSGTFSGGITVNTGGLLEVDISDANLGRTSNGLVLNGGSLLFLNGEAENSGNTVIPITLNAAHTLAIGGSGGTIFSANNNGANLNTIASSISGSGALTAYGFASYNSTNLTLTGTNSNFSGGIVLPNGGLLELHGPLSSGTGPISFANQFATDTLNLRADNASATFSTSGIVLAAGTP